ncbi:MAG: bacteriophage abortive infection AbiH family protein [Mycoplasmoidaceae bacterium]
MNLIIIGNGFDIHHGLKSEFCDYYLFLKKRCPELVNNYYFFPYIVHEEIITPQTIKKEWNDIEQRLHWLFDDKFYEVVDGNYPDMSDENPDWNGIQKVIEADCYWLPKFTREQFKEWVDSIDTSKIAVDNSLTSLITNNNLYLSFNYTKTLEQIYKINEKNIFHIHGMQSDNKIQFGYYSEDEKPIDVINYFENEYGDVEWYSVSIEPGLHSYQKVLDSCFKDVRSNFSKLETFINKDIDKIVILGHSMSQTDELYYSEIIVKEFKNVQWELYYHSEEEKKIKESFCTKYEIKKAKFIKW